MKKFIILAVLLFATNANAGTYSWVKGGVGFGTFDACVSNICFENGEIETSRDFFIQISPVSVRRELTKDFGLRIEPYGGYSERDLRYEGYSVVFDGEVKEFQVGGNLFFDYKVTKNVTVYAGPTAGLEFSQIEGSIQGAGPEFLAETDIMYNFYPGAEAGAEYRIGNIGVGAFWRWTNPDSYQDQTYQVKYDNDRGHQVGGQFKLYWQ